MYTFIFILPFFLSSITTPGLASLQSTASPVEDQGRFSSVDTLDFRLLDQGFKEAKSIYATSQSRVFLVESGRHRLLVLNNEGRRLDSLGNQGFGPYQFDRPLDVDATNGLKIYVTDYRNGRIQVYDRRLQYLSSVTPPAGHDQFYDYQPTEVTVSETREMFFYEGDSGHLIRYNENGDLLSTLRIRTDRRLHPPADLATMNGDLLLADSSSGVIHFLKPQGPYLFFVGGLEGIKSIAATPNYIWALTDHRIVKISGRGRLLKEYAWNGPAAPVDIGVNARQLFLLTNHQLWKGTLEGGGR